MQAGKGLDERIATEVMGRQRAHEIADCGDPFYDYCRICMKGNETWDLKDSPCLADPPYSTDIAAAWEVLEHIANSPVCWAARIEKHPVKGWRAYFETKFSAAALAETPAHAICLAALKAVGCKDL